MLLSEISHSLNDSKAEDLVRIDLRGRSTIGDYMLVVSGRSSRQVNAIAQNLADHLKQRLKLTSRLEGKDSGDWIVVDTGDVIVHIFRPEVREFYQLERCGNQISLTLQTYDAELGSCAFTLLQ